MSSNLNISFIESYLFDLLQEAVSVHTFVGELPDTIQPTWNDMCLIDIGSPLRDRDAYAVGLVNIFLFARPLSDGTKNVALLYELEDKLNAVLNEHVSNFCHISRDATYTDYDTTHKWHCNIITLNIVIV